MKRRKRRRKKKQVYPPHGPLTTHRGGLFSALCTYTCQGEVRDLKSFETPLDFHFIELFSPTTIWMIPGQVENFFFFKFTWGRESREEEKARSEPQETHLKLPRGHLINVISKHELHVSGGLQYQSQLGSALCPSP